MTNTQVISTYQQQGLDFMAKHDLEFKAIHIGYDCPPFCEDAERSKAMDELTKWPRRSHIHGHHYHITLTSKTRGLFTIDYWNSYADEFHNWAIGRIQTWGLNFKVADMIKAERKNMKPATPQPYDVLTCITNNDPGSFDDFCGDFGYDVDSRKAEKAYHAVQQEWSKTRRFFTPEQLVELAEIQ